MALLCAYYQCGKKTDGSRQVEVWDRGGFGARSLAFEFALGVWVLDIFGEFEIPRSILRKSL